VVQLASDNLLPLNKEIAGDALSALCYLHNIDFVFQLFRWQRFLVDNNRANLSLRDSNMQNTVQ